MQKPSLFANGLKQFYLLYYFEIARSIPLQIRFMGGDSQNNTQITQLHQHDPLIKRFPTPERLCVFGQI